MKQTAFERKLSLAMENAFADGVDEIDALVERLNQDSVRDEQNKEWTVDSFRAVMAELGANRVAETRLEFRDVMPSRENSGF